MQRIGSFLPHVMSHGVVRLRRLLLLLQPLG